MKVILKYAILSLVLILSAPGFLWAQVTVSNDVNVLQNLKKQNDCTGSLKGWQITSASATGDGITADAAGYLEGLSLNRIKLCGTLTISYLPELKVLEISETGADDIILDALPALKDLHLGYIQPANFRFLRAMPNLERLQLDSAGLSDIAILADLPLLHELDLSYNHVGSLAPLNGLQNLETVSLYHNNITNVAPLASLTQLAQLDLGVNHITDISPLQGLNELKVLKLEANRLMDISPVQKLLKLTDLDLSENLISDISVLKNLPELVKLDLEDNLVRDLSPLKEGLSRFENMALKGNNIPLHQLYDAVGGSRWAADQRDVYFLQRVQYLPVLNYWVIPQEDLKINDVVSSVRIEGPKGGAVYDAEKGRVVFQQAGNYKIVLKNEALKSEANGQSMAATKSGVITVLDVLPDEMEIFKGREEMISPAVANTLYMLLQTHGVVEVLDDRDPYFNAMWLLKNEVKLKKLYWQ